jgi:hypothetical protein
MTLAGNANFIQARLPLGTAPMVSTGLAAVAVSMAVGLAARSQR